MSISSAISRIAAAKAEIKRAVNAKGGSLTDEHLSEYADAIDSLPPVTAGYLVRFLDFDGTVLKSMYVAKGNSASPPEVPAHPKLRFDHWNNSLENIDRDRDIGAVYTTESGAAEFDVRLLVKTGRSVTFQPNIESGTLTIEWGDGVSSTISETGIRSVSYTFDEYGDYTIRMRISEGGRWALASRFSANSSGYNYTMLAARLVGISRLEDYALSNSMALRYITIDDSLTTLGESVFTGSNVLQAIILPDSVTAIGGYTFSNCTTLREIVLSAGITIIPSTFARYCQGLQNIVIPGGVTAINTEAFSYCSSLCRVSLPSGLRTIGSYAFQYCRALPEIRFPPGMTTVDGYAFNDCASLTAAEFPDSVTGIGTYCFANSYALRHIRFPPKLTQIQAGMCQGCCSVESIEIPENVTRINDDAFYGCLNVRAIKVPAKVTTLRNNAFRNCRGTLVFDFYSETPPSLYSTSIFSEISPACVIRVPKSDNRTVLTAYKTAANWSSYADYIYEREEE